MRFHVEVEWTGERQILGLGARCVFPARLASDRRSLEECELWSLVIFLSAEADRHARCEAEAQFLVGEAPRSWRSVGTELELWEGPTHVAAVRVLASRVAPVDHTVGLEAPDQGLRRPRPDAA